MAGTRNKNTLGNYHLEQRGMVQQAGYMAYKNYGVPDKTFTPGNGLLAGRVGSSQLAYNSPDIESFLRGIGSTNLVEPKTEPLPQFKTMASLDIFDRDTLILPEPLAVKHGQRYNYLN